MNVRLACALMVSAVSLSAAGPREKDQGPPAATGPRTDHAVGYYDARLRRVVLVGAAGDPRDGVRDSVWTWDGRRWELASEAGPPGRVNAGAAFDVRRGIAVVAGGSRKGADGARWQVTGDSWTGGPAAWRQAGDLAPRDHNALVEDERGGVLMFGGIGADRSAPWPDDTWRLEGGAWHRVATDGPGGRGRTADATRTGWCSTSRRAWCCSTPAPARTAARRSPTCGGGTARSGARSR